MLLDHPLSAVRDRLCDSSSDCLMQSDIQTSALSVPRPSEWKSTQESRRGSKHRLALSLT
jgi:hypothetical protein